MKLTLTNGTYLAACATCYFKALDGADIAAYLKEHGHIVTGHRDTGANGEAYTSEGFVVCSNGYTYLKRD